MPTLRPHFGTSMQQTTADWDFAATEAQHLEELGFDSLWASDHMATPTRFEVAHG